MGEDSGHLKVIGNGATPYWANAVITNGSRKVIAWKLSSGFKLIAWRVSEPTPVP